MDKLLTEEDKFKILNEDKTKVKSLLAHYYMG